ncbi:MAG: chorismate synthase [Ruminococcaceae bacterium]|nr:chorismate synthase [Oscillospiraceae bacterium]
MKNTLGSSVAVTLFGESHGKAIGAVLDGLAPGIEVDEDYIRLKLRQRQAVGAVSTPRKEGDEVQLLSGVFEGKSTGTPMAFLIENTNVKSGDYDELRRLMRPGHADYAAYCKYHGYQDYRGGGHFSGRVTAALVAAGAVCRLALRQRGIELGTHILRCGGVDDRGFGDLSTDIAALDTALFPALDESAGEKMRSAILAARESGDSVGGILETAVIGLPAGLGEPWFDTVEGLLSHGLFSIGGIKGVSFGAGFDFADMRGSEANDPFRMEAGRVVTGSNHNGGINGGISNGMPLLFRCAVKPTPSIHKEQQTVDMEKQENARLTVRGRHDPAIIHRVRAVVDAVTAIVLCDLMAQRYGTDWPGERA